MTPRAPAKVGELVRTAWCAERPTASATSSAGRHAELREHAGEVALDRLLGEEQLVGDLAGWWRRSATRSAISSSRPLSAPRPGPRPKRRWRALTRCPRRRSSRAASSRWRLRLARRERALRARVSSRTACSLSPACAERDARERPAARGGHRRVHRLRALGGRAAPARRLRPRRRRRAPAGARACSTHASASGSSSPRTVSSARATSGRRRRGRRPRARRAPATV